MRNKILKILNITIIVILVSWMCIGVWLAFEMKEFEETHELVIRNQLSLEEEINGITLQDLNYETYEDILLLTDHFVIPYLTFSVFCFMIAFSLSEIRGYIDRRMH